jgi:LacI family transcriptional regulator
VTGFDDSPVRRLTRPPLTTVSLPVRELGAEAGRRLFAEIVEKAGPKPAPALMGRLLVGGSS